MKSQFNPSRRKFFVSAGEAGIGLIIAMNSKALAIEKPLPDKLYSPNMWVKIALDGRVFITLAKSEMGQGVMTALPMLVAEELEVPWESVSVIQANSPLEEGYGSQATGGSSSVRGNWESLRQAGALVKALLIGAAAHRWDIAESKCYARSGKIYNTINKLEFFYGELAADAAAISFPERVTLKQPEDFKLVGHSTPRVDIPLHVTGVAQYGTDFSLPGQLTAIVVHSPLLGASPESFNSTEAISIHGVRNIFEINSGIAIVAENYWSAIKAKEHLQIKWMTKVDQQVNSETIRTDFINALESEGIVARKVGDVNSVLARNDITLTTDYELPFQAHATMEPMSCTADFSDGKHHVWAPTQSPQHAYEEVIKYGLSNSASFIEKIRRKLTHTSLDSIQVNTTLLGCGFGRRLQQDYVAEAVQISRTMNAPIRLVWPREEDMKHDYYRPANHNRISAILDDSGKPIAWRHNIVGPSISDYLWDELEPGKVDHLSVEGATDIPYEIANFEVRWTHVSTPVPIGMWRSVGHSQNAFVIESFIDELAAFAKKDPLEYRLSLLNDAPKHMAVLKLCAAKAGWGVKLPKGHFHGVAVHKSYYSYVAHIVELSVNGKGHVRIYKVTSAVDCGIAVNPDIVKAQIEGAIVYGLNATLKSAISIKDGKIEQSNFHDYPLLRFNEMPEIEVHIVKSSEPPTGVGEPGVPPVAPAVANAIFAATGKRIRRLPIEASDLI